MHDQEIDIEISCDGYAVLMSFRAKRGDNAYTLDYRVSCFDPTFGLNSLLFWFWFEVKLGEFAKHLDNANSAFATASFEAPYSSGIKCRVCDSRSCGWLWG